MPQATVLDWSGWRPTNAQLGQMRQLGIVGVQRYETDDAPGNQWKVCTKAEYDNLLAFGFQILAGFEVSKTSWQQGRTLGLVHGQMGRNKWRAKGHPDNRPIAFAIDSDVPANGAAIDTACAYLRGCLDGGGGLPIMSYGETSIIDAAVNRGICVNAWRAAAFGWDRTPSKHASLEQQVTKSYPQFPPDAQGNWPYDENIILKPDWGQHPYQGEDVAIPFTLYQDTAGVLWRVDAGGQSKVRVPDGLPAIAFLFDQLQHIYGATQAECVVRDGKTGEAKKWLDGIPVSPGPPPPPVPVVVDNAAIAKAVNDDAKVRRAGWS